MLEWLIVGVAGYIAWLLREEFEKLPERYVRWQLRNLPADDRAELEQEFLAVLAAETTLGKYVQALQVRGHTYNNQLESTSMGALQANLLSVASAVQTGFVDLDKMIGGLNPSNLIVVAARPGMGKTVFSTNFAEYSAIKNQVPVAIFSMEMPGEHLALRMMSSLGHIDQHKIRTGKLDDDDWPRLTSAVSLLDGAPIFIDDTPALTPIELRARARRLKREHDIGLIVIDNLQLMQASSKCVNRATEIDEISHNLKALAAELEVPVIVLSQLNRTLELRTDRRPVMSDLRESTAIGKVADVIMFIYRDEVYNEDSPQKGLAEIIIGKQRNGPIGKCLLTFRNQYNRFENYTADKYYDGGNSA